MNKYNETEKTLKIKEIKPKEVGINHIERPLKILFICHGNIFI